MQMSGLPCLPDYGNCTLNLIASILRHQGTDCGHPGLPALERALARGPHHVVLLVLDALGSAILERHLPPSSFLRRHVDQEISAVFPSTTTAAMTSFYSGLSPREHGWLGWSLYFKEFGRAVNLFTNQDSLTGQDLGQPHAAHTLLAYPTIFDRMAANQPDAPLPASIAPHGIRLRSEAAEQIGVETFDELCAAIGQRATGPGLTLAYWPEPDGILHDKGCGSPEATACLAELDGRIGRLAANLEDTLLVVTADHGQIDIMGEYWLNDCPELLDCLALPPSVETRAFACFVKAGRHGEFAAAFRERFAGHYELFTRHQVEELGLLGPGPAHPKLDDFLGDFLAVATGNALVRYRSLLGIAKPPHAFKGHHAGLSPEEMRVPLILAGP